MKIRNFRENISEQELWESLYNCYNNSTAVIGTIVSYDVREHYYDVDIDGIHATMYQHELSYARVHDFDAFFGKPLQFIISHIDKLHKTISISRQELGFKLRAGMEARGIVVYVCEYYILIDIGILARVNIRNMADAFVKDVNALYHKGQLVDVVLLEDYDCNKYTEASTKPSTIWAARRTRLDINTILDVCVIDITKDGLKVNIFDNFDGFIHVNYLTKSLKEQFDSNSITIGDHIEVALTGIKEEERKVYLSTLPVLKIKREKAWAEFLSEISIDSILSGTIDKVDERTNGIIVKFNEFVSGYIPFGQLTADLQTEVESGTNLSGNIIEAATTNFSATAHNLYLSMKRILEIEQFKAENELKSQIERGNILSAIVIAVKKEYALVRIEGTNVKAQINRRELSANKIIDASSEVYPGQNIELVYMGETNGRLAFSRKALTSSIYPLYFYDLALDELLKKQGIDTNLFVGRAVKRGTEFFFLDVSSVGSKYDGESFFEGRLLQDALTGQLSMVKAYAKTANRLMENNYYQFSIALAPKSTRVEEGSPFIYQVAPGSSIRPIENPYKREVELVFSKQDSPESNKIIASLLREVGSQLYSEKSRMLFELLQNADDASPSRDQDEEDNAPKVQICIDIREDGIIFQHNGCAFNFEDFRSITSAANSTKGIKKKSTGYKGIGFKSVFTNSTAVIIHSGGFKFWFDRNNPLFDASKFDELYFKVRNITSDEEARKFFSKYAEIRQQYNGIDDIPWQIMPFWDDSNTDTSLLRTAHNDNVVIGLLMDFASVEAYRLAIQEVFNNPRMFLFLRHTRRLQFIDYRETRTQTIHKIYDSENLTITLSHSNPEIDTEKYILFNASDIEISDSAFERAGIGIKVKSEERNGIQEFFFVEVSNGIEGKKVSNIPDKIASANSTSISIAFAVDANGEVIPCPNKEGSSLYAYLPMNEQRFKFPFFINADFVLSSNREGLQADNRWNIFLFHQLGKLVIEALRSIANTSNPKYLLLLPNFFETGHTATSAISEAFNISFLAALNTQKFILDENSGLCSQDEIILDKTGLSQIIGNELFRSLLSTSKRLPHQSLNIEPLSREYFKYIETVGYDDINQILLNEERVAVINDWIINSDSDEAPIDSFYDWLIKHCDQINVQSIINNLKIVNIGDSVYSLNQLYESDILILSDEAFEISTLLKKLQIPCNSTDLSTHKLSKYIRFSNNIDIYNRLIEHDLSILNYMERLSLFRTLRGLTGIGDAKLKQIPLFKSTNGKLIPLAKAYIIPERLNEIQLPTWYCDYALSKDELCFDASHYLPCSIKESFDIAFSNFIDSGSAPINEFYDFFMDDGVWDSSNTAAIINKYGYSEEILYIVEDSDKDRKRLYLNKIEKFSLSSSEHYDADSLEYRVLNMAISSGNIQLLKEKTYIDGIPLCQYAISDTITYDNKLYRLNLSDILPGLSSENALGRIKMMFASINNIDTFFTQEEKDKTSLRYEFIAFISNSYRVLNWAQVAFISLESQRASYNWSTYRSYIHLPEGESILNIFTPLADRNWSHLLKGFISSCNCSFPEIKGKFFDSIAFTLPEERVPSYIEEWICDPAKHEQRTRLLLEIGAFSPTHDGIKRRKRFLGDNSADANWHIFGDAVSSFCNWVINSQKLPILSQEQKDIIKILADNAPQIIVRDFDQSRLTAAIEYDDESYQNWRKTAALSIYLINGKIPRIYKFKGVVLYGFDEDDIDYSSATKIVYVNANGDIETLMTTLLRQSCVPFNKDDWDELFKVNRSELKKVLEDYKQLREEFDQFQRQNSENFGKLHKPGEIDGKTQNELNRAARYRAKDFLINNGYECSDWDPEIDQRIYQTKKNGEVISFVVASCRSGLVYLHAYKFATLMENPHNLLLIDDGKIIQALSFGDAFNSNSNVNLIFDVNYITPTNLANIARMMQHYPMARFVFDKPGYSLSDEIRTFGLNERHDGEAPIIEDINDLE